MKLLMHILKKNKKLNIDNRNITFRDMQNKLVEECCEVGNAIAIYGMERTLCNLKEIIRETFDVIQICILILWRCHRISKIEFNKPNLIQQINLEHKDKLISERGWDPYTGIEIEVKE